jgi:ribosomal protein S18 acetylase RimI-like enzyme
MPEPLEGGVILRSGGTVLRLAGAVLRRARPGDRAALYAVCLATGRDGEDAGPLFRDPELLGHRYVGPYLDLEPDLAFVLEDAAGPCGYVLGAADSVGFYRRLVDDWLPALRPRLSPPPPPGQARTGDEHLLAELHAPTITLPRDLAAYPAHLHIDLLPRVQGRGHGRRMMRTLLDALEARGAVGVHLGVSASNHRAQGFYRALGFATVAAEPEDPHGVVMGRGLG